MTEDESRMEDVDATDPAQRPARTALMLVSGLFVAGLGALAYSTAPSHSAASTSMPAVYLPASAATEDPEQSRDSMPVSVNNSVDFIVRFKDVEEVVTCLDMFKEDPEGAREIFAGWAGRHDTLSGMTLKRTSYAGEVILSWSTEDGHRPNRADIITKQQDLQAMPVVKYADPDYTAHAGDTTQ